MVLFFVELLVDFSYTNARNKALGSQASDLTDRANFPILPLKFLGDLGKHYIKS